ncbi:hydrolase [Pseudogracilibacillus sp. SE30717A]|uniref:hydrolase n=1 Tax=Pseudogracilibacillus sp. SE30717A TaxID=3098293 RepID=UPI00300E6901
MLKIDNTALVLIDVQGKLAKIMHQSKELLVNLERLIQGAHLLEIPIIWLEQYPKGLGPTADEIKQHLAELRPIDKMTFSACKNDDFQKEIASLEKMNYLVAGIESHICVYQTVSELLNEGNHVEVVIDGVSSRTLANKEVGIEKMKSLGAQVTSVEMALFELMETAEHPKFKEISKLIK